MPVDWQVHLTEEHVGTHTYRLWSLASFEAASADLYGQLRGRGSPALRDDLSPMFGVMWGAARVLAEWVDRVGPRLQGARVLELGCGLALPSLVAARHGADVVATDQHPDTGALLARNAALNGVQLRYETLDWRRPRDLGRFDWVLASDVLFARELPALVVQTMAGAMAPDGVGWLADPGRTWASEAEQAADALGLPWRLEVDAAGGEEAFVWCFGQRAVAAPVSSASPPGQS